MKLGFSKSETILLSKLRFCDTEPETLFLEDPLAFKDNYIFEEEKLERIKHFLKNLALFLIEISGSPAVTCAVQTAV